MAAPGLPRIGKRLPHAGEALGIAEKLTAYCLNLDHEVGGPKAQGFERLLGIGVADVAYLADALQTGVLTVPITRIRDNAPFGMLCEIRIPVAGLHHRRHCVFEVTTAWELRHETAAPRLVTAYVNG